MNELVQQLLTAYTVIAVCFMAIFMAWQMHEIGKLGPLHKPFASVQIWGCIGRGIVWPIIVVAIILITVICLLQMIWEGCHDRS